MEISLLREELKVVINNISQQHGVVKDLCKEYDAEDEDTWDVELDDNTCSSCFESLYSTTPEGDFVVNMATRKKLKEIQSNLLDRQDVLEELSTRVDSLESQVRQPIYSAIFQTNSFIDSPTG